MDASGDDGGVSFTMHDLSVDLCAVSWLVFSTLSSNIGMEFLDFVVVHPSTSGRLRRASLIESSERRRLASLFENRDFWVFVSVDVGAAGLKNLLCFGETSLISASSHRRAFLGGLIDDSVCVAVDKLDVLAEGVEGVPEGPGAGVPAT